MEVQLLTPKDLFDQSVRYVVPDYQRKYVWEQEKQWEPLLDDVLNLAEQAAKPARRSGDAAETVHPHFMGSIILMPMRQADTASRVAQIAIVDGQQRLLTLQLMLDAAQQECENRRLDVAREFTRLVLQRPEDRGDRGEHDFKMWPTDPDDQAAFRHAMRNDLPTDAYEKERIVEAHNWFAERIGQWLDRPPKKAKQRATALHSALAEHIQVAAIMLGDEDDEQIIFETLNSRGTELGTFELVKNFLLREARKQQVDPGSMLRLLEPLDKKWWSGTTGSGRARRPHVEAFLHHWLTMETTQEIKLEQTFSRFREHIRARNGGVEQVAQDLADFAAKYRELQTADKQLQANDPFSRRFRDFVLRWKILQADVFTPLILWLWVRDKSDERVSKAYTALESYMVRRLICGLDTRGYGATTRQLLVLVKDRGRKGTDRIIIEHLHGLRSDRERWPSDSDVVESLVNNKLLGRASVPRARMILECIESEFRGSYWWKRGDELAARRFSVEHIMPRQWQNANWPPPSPRLAHRGKTAEQIRGELVHSIGNLTLVPQRYNSRLTTAGWTRKRELYEEEPGDLVLNNKLLHPGRAAAPHEWDEEQIRKRSEQLAKRVIKIWPRPS